MPLTLFSSQDSLDFKSWLNFDKSIFSWSEWGSSEFDEHWKIIFLDVSDAGSILERLDFLISFSLTNSNGPIISWYKWLKNKFICYLFLKKQMSVREISQALGIDPAFCARVLRDFFVEQLPFLDRPINLAFQIFDVSSENIEMDYKSLALKLNLRDTNFANSEEDIMPTIEVMLYPEWRKGFQELKKRYTVVEEQNKVSFRERYLPFRFKLLSEVFIYLFIAFGIFGAIVWTNKIFHQHLVDKISIYEPKYLWTDKVLKFKLPSEMEAIAEVPSELEEVSIADAKVYDIGQNEYSPESDVSLTSLERLPRDLDYAGLDKSSYEEEETKGYRDSRFGENKIYRVIMKSPRPELAKADINRLIEKYRASQADAVKMGTHVPGGLYYNLFVPRKHLKEFLTQVMDVDEASLFETRTSGTNPPEKNKVFIWVKII